MNVSGTIVSAKSDSSDVSVFIGKGLRGFCGASSLMSKHLQMLNKYI
jgi:hypothetical protein